MTPLRSAVCWIGKLIEKGGAPTLIWEYLKEIAEDPEASPRDLAWLVRNSTAGLAAAEARKDIDDAARWGITREKVACNPNTPEDALTELAGIKEKPEDVFLRIAVAQNPSASPELLAKLSMDADCLVRGNAARHPNTPMDILVKLAGDDEASARGGVARNRNAPPEVLATLTKDSSAYVRTKAEQTLRLGPLDNAARDEIQSQAIRRLKM